MESSISFARPPLLNEKNYSYWKVKVKAFIKALDEKVWDAILTRLSPSTITTNEVTTTKFEKTWTKVENSLANINFKALNVIFAFVDIN